ncbi:Hypothetical predicted protein [Octopus vulgaris]|uniref:Uncharacterized protein n=1 Tax=Octopus vulgaris TaxID=6645 RepID=A0AA36B449_OCTVU|nr:Hypothetical predicted protein [Octopus vulgaris]
MYYSCNNINGGTYYQFHRCPNNYDVTEHVNNCENPNSDQQLHDVPAFGKMSKKLYRNLYCALCHGEEYILWNVSKPYFSGDMTFSIESVEVEKQVSSREINQYLYKCAPYISECTLNNPNKTLENLCKNNGMRLVTANNTDFRNIYCALCNGFEIYDIHCDILYVHPRLVNLDKPLTGIFVVSVKSKEMQKEISIKDSCVKNTVYDMNTKQCRQVSYNSILNCTATRLNESEYHITNDGLLYLNNTHRLLNQSDFGFDDDGTIIICVKNIINVLRKYSEAESYITLVGLIFSIPALAITIIVYLCIPDLRTLPASDLETPYPSMYYSCNNINGGNYYQFHRCPNNYDVTEHVNNCENPNSDQQLHDVPAFGKTSKQLYRNLYCALCHGEEYILWNVSYPYFAGDMTFSIESVEVEKQVSSREINQYLYKCAPYISECTLNNPNKTLENLCKNNGMSLVTANNTDFRNIYCALCNGFEIDDIHCDIPNPSFLDIDITLTDIFDASDKSKEMQKEILIKDSCVKNTVYDKNTKQCRQVSYNSTLNCTATRLNVSEYYITNDGLLYLNNTHRLLNQSDFGFDEDGTIIICVKNIINVLRKYSEAESYITQRIFSNRSF